jgi:hypothetical protein
VARLGEFLPFGRLFTLGTFLNLASRKHFLASFLNCIHFDKKMVGLYFVCFYRNSSGVDVMITIFCDFCQFSDEKIGVFLKNQCYDPFLAKTSSSLSKKRHFVRQFFLANIFLKS